MAATSNGSGNGNGNGNILGPLLSRYLQLLIVVVTIGVAYQRIRGDLDTALIEVHRLVDVLESQQQSVKNLEIKQERMEQNVVDFRQVYERDMSRYIRETPSR